MIGFCLQLLCQLGSSKKTPLEESQRAVTPKSRAIAPFSKLWAKQEHLQQPYAGAAALALSLPTASPTVQGSPGEGTEHQRLIPNPIQRGGSPLLSTHETPQGFCSAVGQSWPHGSLRMLTARGLSMEGCRHQGNKSQLRTETGDQSRAAGCTTVNRFLQ